MVLQPAGERLVVYLVREYLALQVISVPLYPCLLLLVQLHLELGLLLLVVELKGHSVEVQSFSWREVHVVTLLGECVLDGLLAWELLIADLDEKSDHLADLMVDEALADEGEADEGDPMRLAFFLIGEAFLEVLVDHLLLDQLSPHGDDEPVASRIASLVSLGEVVEVVSAQVKSHQIVQLGDYPFSFQLVQNPLGFVVLLAQEQLQWRDVVVHPRTGVVPHVECLP